MVHGSWPVRPLCRCSLPKHASLNRRRSNGVGPCCASRAKRRLQTFLELREVNNRETTRQPLFWTSRKHEKRVPRLHYTNVNN